LEILTFFFENFSTLKDLQSSGRRRDEESENKICQLQLQLSQTTLRLDEINSNYEELKNRGDLKLDELKLELDNRENETKQKMLNEQQEITNKFENKRKEIEENCEKQIRRYENKINEIERARDENIQKRVKN